MLPLYPPCKACIVVFLTEHTMHDMALLLDGRQYE